MRGETPALNFYILLGVTAQYFFFFLFDCTIQVFFCQEMVLKRGECMEEFLIE